MLGLLDADALHPYKGEEEHVSESPLAKPEYLGEYEGPAVLVR